LEISNDIQENQSILDFFMYVSQTYNFEEPFKASFALAGAHDKYRIYFGEQITAED
jgi:hypothetical protein